MIEIIQHDHCMHGICILKDKPTMKDCKDCDGYNEPDNNENEIEMWED